MFFKSKRIKELERQVEILARCGNPSKIVRLEAEIEFLKTDVAYLNKRLKSDYSSKHDFKEDDICRIPVGVVETGRAPGITTIITNYIPAKEAIKRIMDHLGIEFDTIPEKKAETVIIKRRKSGDQPEAE